MKTTIRAILININKEYKDILDGMMLVFSTAERFAFKRLLEGMEKGELEKRIIAIEDLKFKDDRDVTGKFARLKHQFIYSTLLAMLERACIRNGIEIIKVKPQFTSKIGLYKYCHQYGICVHNGAAMVIGRRSYCLKERIPKILRDKLIQNKEEFLKQNEWKRWTIINNIIERKGGENPGLWMENRKEILGIDKVS